MAQHRLGIIMNGVTGRMGMNQHLIRSILAIRAQGWPIQLMQVLFAKYVVQWIDVEGLENLPLGSYVVAANHAYKSGVDGFILGAVAAGSGSGAVWNRAIPSRIWSCSKWT